jgi:hypothetical protein
MYYTVLKYRYSTRIAVLRCGTIRSAYSNTSTAGWNHVPPDDVPNQELCISLCVLRLDGFAIGVHGMTYINRPIQCIGRCHSHQYFIGSSFHLTHKSRGYGIIIVRYPDWCDCGSRNSHYLLVKKFLKQKQYRGYCATYITCTVSTVPPPPRPHNVVDGTFTSGTASALL